MRDRLADDVVNRNEGSLRSEGIDKRPSHVLCTGQKWFHQVLRQIKQRVDVLQWSDEYVTFEDRPVIKKCDHVVGTEHDRCVNITAADLAEHIVGHRHETSAIRVGGREPRVCCMLADVSLSDTPRSTLTRLRERARSDRADLYAVLDAGPPSEEADDIAPGGRWAGVLPVRTVFDTPESCPTVPAGEPVPGHVLNRIP
jgi:hypothetical protein